jgi:hypothetical protein
VANNGSLPEGNLTLGGTTLYGMTSMGGAYDVLNRWGTIFKIETDGSGFTVPTAKFGERRKSSNDKDSARGLFRLPEPGFLLALSSALALVALLNRRARPPS